MFVILVLDCVDGTFFIAPGEFTSTQVALWKSLWQQTPNIVIASCPAENFSSSQRLQLQLFETCTLEVDCERLDLPFQA